MAAGLFFSTGNYGTRTAFDMLYVPISARYDSDEYSIGLTVPYLSVTGNGHRADGEVFFDSQSKERVTSEGLGDVVASASRTVYRGLEPLPWVDLTGVVKFGTADRKQELGSGENDYAAQVDLYQRVGRANWFASVGYKVPGSPPGVQYHSVFYGSAGAQYFLTPSHGIGAMLSGQEALTEAGFAQGEASAFYSWIVNPAYRLQLLTSWGFMPGSPDWSVGTTLARAF